MLSERRASKVCMSLLKLNFGEGKNVWMENRSVVARTWSWGQDCQQRSMRKFVGVMELFNILTVAT